MKKTATTTTGPVDYFQITWEQAYVAGTICLPWGPTWLHAESEFYADVYREDATGISEYHSWLQAIKGSIVGQRLADSFDRYFILAFCIERNHLENRTGMKLVM